MDKFNYNENKKKYNYYKDKVNIVSSMRLILFLMIIISFFIASSYNIFMYIGFILMLIFLLLIFIHNNYYKKLEYYSNILTIIDEYKKRVSGKWREFNDTGIDYQNELFNDLNIVGKNSLFQYLSVCRTLDGRDNLINKLSNKKIDISKLKENQNSIKELSSKHQFVFDFQSSMFWYRDKSIRLSDAFIKLDKKVGKKTIDLFVGYFLSLISILLLILGSLKIVSINYFYFMFIINFFINYMYSFFYSEDFDNINHVTYSYDKLLLVYNTILANNFDSKVLKDIKNKIFAGKKSMNRLVLINDLNNFKDNILSSFIFNGLFSLNMIVMYMYSLFQKDDIKAFKDAITCVSELEALISLSGLGIIRDDVSIPEVCSETRLEFNNIKHPLIDQNKCVGNDFRGSNGVNIITGSNMGGKTSFLRTIGVNLILMNAGGFVCSDFFKSCYFKIFTSIKVEDDINGGISTFYGELLRIKKALNYKTGNRLILIDEIFKGTNYNDRIYGAVNVIKKLDDDRTITFITTHDFELCDVKIDNLDNYYFKEYYEGDNIRFDYKIRHGKCDSTNAKYLMEKLAIIDE